MPGSALIAARGDDQGNGQLFLNAFLGWPTDSIAFNLQNNGDPVNPNFQSGFIEVQFASISVPDQSITPVFACLLAALAWISQKRRHRARA